MIVTIDHTKNCVLSLDSRHSVGPGIYLHKHVKKCVFDNVIVLDQTLCLQPMAGHSVLAFGFIEDFIANPPT